MTTKSYISAIAPWDSSIWLINFIETTSSGVRSRSNRAEKCRRKQLTEKRLERKLRSPRGEMRRNGPYRGRSRGTRPRASTTSWGSDGSDTRRVTFQTPPTDREDTRVVVDRSAEIREESAENEMGIQDSIVPSPYRVVVPWRSEEEMDRFQRRLTIRGRGRLRESAIEREVPRIGR